MRNETELLLILQSNLALAVPAVVELPLVLVSPLFVHVVWAMTGAWRKIDEERLFRRGCLLLSDPANCLFGHGFGEMPLRVVMRRLDRRGVLEQRRVPLARLSTLKPVPVAKAFARGPAVEGPVGAELEVRGIMPFAEGGGTVSVALQNLRDARRFSGPLTVIAGEASRHLRDHAGVDRVMIASGEERRTRRRAERCRMEAVVAQALVGQPLKRRRVGRAAERARLTETNVIKQDRQYVGGTRRRRRQ